MTVFWVVAASETSVNFYQITRRNNQKDSHLHIRRRENRKSHLEILLFLLRRKWYHHILKYNTRLTADEFYPHIKITFIHHFRKKYKNIHVEYAAETI
jgi:hypothetical protein